MAKKEPNAGLPVLHRSLWKLLGTWVAAELRVSEGLDTKLVLGAGCRRGRRTYHSGRNRRPDAYGGSNTLDNLIRNSAGRCAIDNYAKAVIIDRHKGGKVVVTLRRTAGGITIHRED